MNVSYSLSMCCRACRVHNLQEFVESVSYTGSNFLVTVHCCLEALVSETVHIADDPLLVVSPWYCRCVNVGRIVSAG